MSEKELGFPFYGYHLFRRRHRRRGNDERICVISTLPPFEFSVGFAKTLSTSNGNFISDKSINFTDEFPQPDNIEIDLANRKGLRFDLNPSLHTNRIEVQLGFRTNESAIADFHKSCINLHEQPIGLGDNPRVLDNATFESQNNSDNPQLKTRIAGWQITGDADFSVGLVVDKQLSITLPCPSSIVRLNISHFQDLHIKAFNKNSEVVAEQVVNKPVGNRHTVRITGTSIHRIVIKVLPIQLPIEEDPDPRLVSEEADSLSTRTTTQLSEVDNKAVNALRARETPNEPQIIFERDKGLLHSICYQCSTQSITITARSGDEIFDVATVVGQPGETHTTTVQGEDIRTIELTSAAVALIDLCFHPTPEEDMRGWEPVPDFSYPLCLPLTHPDYPCSGGQPKNLANAETTAMGRIHYGSTTAWAGQAFDDLHTNLIDLVVGGPGSKPMAERTVTWSATPAPDDPQGQTPELKDIAPLDLIIMGTLHPAFAQIVGLYWVDQTVLPGQAFDYLIVADSNGVLSNNPLNSLQWLQTNGFDNLHGDIVYNLAPQPQPQLPAPQELRGYALPGITLHSSAGDLRDATNNAGLRWQLGHNSEGLVPGAAVMYHLWRADIGTQQPAIPLPVSQHTLLTADKPIVATEPDLPSGTDIERPSDWPPFPLHAFDRALVNGWYSYLVSGIDLFGRHTLHSDPAEWYQWSPAPDPLPWYYQAPADDRQVHPFALELRDTTPPPRPTGVEAYTLDPLDPLLVRDTDFDTWWSTLSPTEQDSILGLRVRWKWTHMHMEQAPDTAEFRLYFEPGIDPPTDFILPEKWQNRIYTVTYDQHVTEEIVPALDPNGNILERTTANINNDQINLIGRLDLSNIRPFHDFIFFANDTVRPDGKYRILEVDALLNTVIIDGLPSIEPLSASSWIIGWPLRQYELFLPTQTDTQRDGVALTPTLADPLLYAHIGVTAVDDKVQTGDNPRWDGTPWGKRTGNEGHVGPPAKIYAVWRKKPDPPEPPPTDAEKVWATPADYHSRTATRSTHSVGYKART